MKNKLRNHIAQFKANVAMAAAKGDKTIAELSSEFGIHPNQITQWKKQLLESLPEIFSHRRQNNRHRQEDLISELYFRLKADATKQNMV